jgi:hypothetical protein
MTQGSIVNPARWYRFARSASDLGAATSDLSHLIVVSRNADAGAFTLLPSGQVYSEQLIVFALQGTAAFCVLQSRIHETWMRFFASSMKDDLRYTPTDCFETFPFPQGFETNHLFESAGRTYYAFRAALMVKNNEGLTKTYNRFHDPDETSPDILKLRELHSVMDRAVLDGYGWTDIPTDCEFLLDWEDDEEETGRRRKKPWRLRWPGDVRDEVLARLLALNGERGAEEERAGVAATATAKASSAKPRRARKPTATGVTDLFDDL